MQLIYSPSGRTADLPDQTRNLAEEFHTSMMDSNELLYLAGVLSLYPWNGEAIVVEIGAYAGQTTVFMVKVLQLLQKHVSILSIDPFERAVSDSTNPRGNYSAYLKKIRHHNVEDTCLALVAFSEQAAAVVPEKIGVLVVDGSHRYPDVTKDLSLYVPKLLPGGLIFVDDYIPAYPGVMRAVDEYLGSTSALEIVHKTYFVVAQRNALPAVPKGYLPDSPYPVELNGRHA
jgi:predicted O-methyltransferase YrrM